MKKILLGFLVLSLILCSCQKNSKNFSSISLSDSNSEAQQIKQYHGKEEYEEFYGGHKIFTQNQSTYFYSDQFGLYSLDKQGKTPKLISDYATLGLQNSKNFIYYQDFSDNKMVLYDTNNGKISQKYYQNLFPIESYEKSGYSISFVLIDGGWLVHIIDFDSNAVYFYKTDIDFTSKTEISLKQYGLILDDDVFYLDENGNVACYNLKSQKESFVTKQFSVTEDDIIRTDRFIKYLGRDKIMIYAQEKLHIINLIDGSIFKTIDYPIKNFDYPHPSVAYNDEKIYLQLWENEENYRIEEVRYTDGVSSVIYRGKINLPIFSSMLVAADNQYIYIGNLGHFDEEQNPTSHFLQIKNDGTQEKIIIRETNPE